MSCLGSLISTPCPVWCHIFAGKIGLRTQSLNKEDLWPADQHLLGALRAWLVTIETFCSDHNLPSLPHFSPEKRLGFTGPTGLWASETSLATASLSDPCRICAPSQSLGVQDEEGCWHCNLALPSGWGWDVEQAGTPVSLSLQVHTLYCAHIYKYVFLLPQIFVTLVTVWGQVPWMQSLREGFPCTGFIIGEQDEAGEVHQACDLSWSSLIAWGALGHEMHHRVVPPWGKR